MHNLKPVANIIDSLKPDQLFRFPAFGHSMIPQLHPGDILIGRKPALGHKFFPGDIIVFRSPHKTATGASYLAHRIIRITVVSSGNTILTCKGDAVYRADSPLKPDQVLLKIEGYERNDKEYELSRHDALTRFAVNIPITTTFIIRTVRYITSAARAFRIFFLD